MKVRPWSVFGAKSRPGRLQERSGAKKFGHLMTLLPNMSFQGSVEFLGLCGRLLDPWTIVISFCYGGVVYGVVFLLIYKFRDVGFCEQMLKNLC